MFRTDRRKQVVSSDWLIQLPVSKAWNSECRLASASIHNDINKSDQRAGKALQWSCRSITWKRSIHKSLSDPPVSSMFGQRRLSPKLSWTHSFGICQWSAH